MENSSNEGESRLITLKYREEADDSQYPERKFTVKNTLGYDEGKNDFLVEIEGERLYMEYTGESIKKEFPDVVDAVITRDTDRLTIEFLDKNLMVHHKTVISNYSFDYFTLTNIKI